MLNSSQRSEIAEMAVKDAMSTNIIILKEDDPISFVVGMFERCHISGAAVANSEGDYIGVISKTDLIEPKFMNYIAEGRTPDKILTKELMKTTTLITVEESSSVAEAISLMADNKVHRVFVKNLDGKISGILSTFDVIKLFARNIKANSPYSSYGDVTLPESTEISHLKQMLDKKQNELMWNKNKFQ